MNDNEKNNDYFIKFYFSEYSFLMVLALLICLLFSILGFYPEDNNIFHSYIKYSNNNQDIRNPFGILGANFSELFLQLFGIGSFLILLFMFIILISLYKKQVHLISFFIKISGYLQFFICIIPLVYILKNIFVYKGLHFYSTGYLGYIMGNFLLKYSGYIGTIILLLAGILSSLPLCLGIQPVDFMIKTLQKIPLRKLNFFIQNVHIKKEEIQLNSDMHKNLTDTHQKNNSLEIVKTIDNNNLIIKDINYEILDMKTPIKYTNNNHEKYDFNSVLKLLLYYPKRNNDDNLLEKFRLEEEARLLEEKFNNFGITGSVIKSQPGPVVNIHEYEPSAGIKVSKILGLYKELALGLKAESVLMSPQAGKSTIGIEIPAQIREIVSLREILESEEFLKSKAILPLGLGKLVDGSILIGDLSAMPHLLVAGSTGSGKSVGINVMILSLIMRYSPEQVRFILVDPKMLELSTYDGIGHLLMPVVTEADKAAGALRWAIDEMERRYKLMKALQVRNILSYNSLISNKQNINIDNSLEIDINLLQTLPYIVVVIDELCDLMMTAPKDVEDCVQRLAQKARAAGIHLILATQRPSVDVLTGVIKANLPCRLSFQVASTHDSRTTIETSGAEKLLGKGDMLFLPPGTNKLLRAQSAFVGDKEIALVTDKLRSIYPVSYDTSIIDKVEEATISLTKKDKNDLSINEKQDNNKDLDDISLYNKTVEFAIDSGTVSTSSIQRHFRIGYNKAAIIMDQMQNEGIVGPSDVAGKPRQVLIKSKV